ncbi:flagellar basal-body rod protein FlgG [bacterium]|nr:flagellar basal-body rod protein FlgG [bacterium]
MMRSLFTGASGMRGQQFRIDVTANNLANANTVGFKSDRAEFADLLYQQLRRPGGTSATGIQWPTALEVGLGVTYVGTAKNFAQGSYLSTGQPLDMIIEGDGFFQVQLGDGTIGYTRDGSFKLDAAGSVVNNEGLLMIPSITVPEDAIQTTISRDGSVFVSLPGQVESTQVGQITLVRLVNPQGLEAIGGNVYKETDASGTPLEDIAGQSGLGAIRQGFLEASNVSVVDELVNLIISQRAYEANSRSVQTADEMLQSAVNLKR